MDKYIISLLEDNNRVIIPNFGSFIKRPGEDNAVSFNEFLKFDDGLLTDYIVVRERLSKEGAKEKIDSFIKDIQDAFSAGKPYALGKLGFLQKSGNGKIELVEKAGEAKTVEKETKPATAKKEEKPKEEKATTREEVKPSTTKSTSQAKDTGAAGTDSKKEQKGEEKKPASTTPASKPGEKKATEPKASTPPAAKSASPEKSTEKKPAANAGTKDDKKTTPGTTKPAAPTTTSKTPTAKPASTPGTQSKPSSSSATRSYSSTTGATTKTSSGGSAKPSKEGSKSNKSLLLVVIIGVVVVGLGAAGYFLRDKWLPIVFKDKYTVSTNDKEQDNKEEKDAKKEKATTGKKEQVAKDTSSTVKKEEQKEDKTNTAEKDANQVKTPGAGQTTNAQPASVNTYNRYHVVAGCFQDEWRAVNYVKTLQAKGFNNARIFGRIGTYHAICYDSYATKGEALNELQKIRNNHQMKGWVTHQ